MAEGFKLNLNLPKTETSSRSSSGFPRDSNGLPKAARSTAEGLEATVRGDEYSNRTLHRESKEEIHAFDNEPSGLMADDHDLLSCSSQSLQCQLIPLPYSSSPRREVGIVIFAWSSLQATVTDHCIREVVMRLAARHMGQAMELVPLVAGNGLGICAVDGGRSGVMNRWRGERALVL
ncbi:uncharacterized protein K441DRAFT_671060 [Cenococcum geophilum 1.58]|uniref:Uncharacterized protein n=1 Tax=Cenococcum geophilum 1.58 TaxID=794803 RepID=A0ACC8ELV0_9PEZI|nr:hypothetical protein K441DRAFT_671060 [Cenococcum geophilum 1.58]